MGHEQIQDAVFVFGHPVGETEIYESIRAAGLALEPWQLDDTLAVDGRAHRVALQSFGPRVSAHKTEEEVDRTALRRRVMDDLLNAGVSPRTSGDLLDLLEQLAEFWATPNRHGANKGSTDAVTRSWKVGCLLRRRHPLLPRASCLV
jgi:hypothetical protein